MKSKVNMMKKNILSENKFYNVMITVALLICLVQILCIVIGNLTQLKYHIGYDASSYYLQTIEMWEQRTLFPENWVYQTTLYTDSPVPIAMLIYGITKNIFLSYGIANILCFTMIIYTFYSIIKSFKFSVLAKLISLNLLMSPFLGVYFNNANDIGYFSVMFTSMGAYSVKILIFLLAIKVIILLEGDINSKKVFLIQTLVIGLSLVAGISSGYYILAIAIIPLLGYMLIKALVKNELSILWNKQSIFLYINILAIFIGKKIATSYLGFVSKESTLVFTGLEDFFKNLQSIFLGYLDLLSALPVKSDVPIISIAGISFSVNLGIALIIILGSIWYIYNIKNTYKYNTLALLPLCVGIGNVLIFVFSYTTYGAPIFEVRYLIPIYLLLIIFIGKYIDGLDHKLLFKKLGVLGLVGTLIISNMVSFTMYFTRLNDYTILKSLSERIGELDSPVVYMYGESIGVNTRNMRVIDTSKIYKYINNDLGVHHWGDYTYYDENAEYEGKTILVTTAMEYEKLPSYIKSAYVFIDNINIYNIYISEKNIMDLVAGITENRVNRDFMYTKGVQVANGEFNEQGEYVTNDTGGFVLWGPYTSVEDGKYDFILNYEIEQSSSEDIGHFEITIREGTQQLGVQPLDKNANRIIIKNVEFNNRDERLEYRVWINPGTKINLKSVEIIRE